MSIKSFQQEFTNEFSALVSRTAAMTSATAVLTLDPGDFVSAVAVLPTSFLDRRQHCSIADVAQITGATWQVTLRSSEISFE